MMNEDKILDKIRRSADSVEVPGNLSPDNIRKHLDETATATTRHFPVYKIACAAAAVFVVVLSGWGLLQVYEGASPAIYQTNDITAESTSDSIDEDRLSTVKAGSYEELYAALDQMNSSSYNDTGKTYATANDEASSIDSSYEIATEDIAAEAATASYDPATDTHSTTNTQTAGVDEGDIVKTDGSYIYSMYQSGGKIRIADATQMSSVAEITLDTYDQTFEDMYLADGKLLAIACGTTSDLSNYSEDTYQVNSTTVTTMYTYDISDPTAPKLIGSVEQSGDYASSRKSGDYLYLFTNFDTVIPSKKDAYEEYIPSAGGSLIPEEDIYIPEICQQTRQLVISSVNVNEPDKIVDKISILSGTDLYYVSSKHIFTANSQWSANGQITQIISFAYENGEITAQAAGSIGGYLNDNFSLDEYDGYLRVVATDYNIESSGSGIETAVTSSTEVNVLYVLDENLNITGKIDDLAPGETIQSARFMKDTGYFVTYRQMDPLFSVDLSDPENPKILGELKITGFSEYLHFYDDDLLLGIGWESDPDTGTTEGLKLSMFDISDPSNVTEKHKLVIDGVYNCSGINNYKAVMIDPEKNLFGFAYEGDTDNGAKTFSNYGVFSYDRKTGFISAFTCSLENEPDGYASPWLTRGLYINDTFYLATDKTLTSFDMTADYKALARLTW